MRCERVARACVYASVRRGVPRATMQTINVSRRKVPLEVLGSPKLGSSPAFSRPFADASCAWLGVADGGGTKPGWSTDLVFGRFRLRRFFPPVYDADDPGVRTSPTQKNQKQQQQATLSLSTRP